MTISKVRNVKPMQLSFVAKFARRTVDGRTMKRTLPVRAENFRSAALSAVRAADTERGEQLVFLAEAGYQ